MAYDFQNEKFSMRIPIEEIGNLPRNVVEVAQALWKHKVKLGATLARMRVKDNARNVTQLISTLQTRRRYERTKETPYYLRLNLNKGIDMHKDILSRLQWEGFSIVQHQADLCRKKRSVYQASKDLLIFSPDCRECVDTHEFVTKGYLTAQV